MGFEWTKECSAKVKAYRESKSSATRQTLNVNEFLNLLNANF